MSLDERRAKFKANHYHLRHEHEQKGTKFGEMPRSNHHHIHLHRSHDHDHDQDHKISPEEKDGPPTTDVREVWFAGCHCGMCYRLKAAFPI